MASNRLGASASPYLLQHADNPVHWHQWGNQAFEEAKTRNVPIHLSIGYAACHWCHVMAHESFENPETAALMNQHFVNIKVDREERPDVDQIYMQALHGLGEQGGWPLTMFLTPEGHPFWGGTYFPPEARWGRPSFRQVLLSMSNAWQSQDPAVANNSAALLEMLQGQGASQVPDAIIAPTHTKLREMIDRSAARILSAWDTKEGGFQGAPKFPQVAVMELLWRAFRRTGNEKYRDAVIAGLDGIVSGGIYDHIAGGFSRYSVDQHWLVPHFEKMLYDNAQLLSLLALVFSHTKNPLYAQKIEETVAWLQRDMSVDGGAFAASLDADTLGEEGLTYVWTPNEIDKALAHEDARAFCEHYDISEHGNFEGKSIPNRLAKSVRSWLGERTETRLAEYRRKLLKIRSDRPQPGRDHKVLADWNGALIFGLIEAGQRLDRPEWIDLADRCYNFVNSRMQAGGRLAHAWVDGRTTAPGIATDFAQMMRASLALYGATAKPEFLLAAKKWQNQLDEYFWNEELGSYRLAANDTTDVIARPASLQDDAMPSATGLMAQNLALLFLLTGNTKDANRIELILRRQSDRIESDCVSTASLQSAIDTVLRGRTAILIAATDKPGGMAQTILAEADPGLFILPITSPGQVPEGSPAKGKSNEGDGETLYVCRVGTCFNPVTDDQGAESILRETRSES